eukprot:3020052-Prymnesium_polylepis.1
MTRSAGVAYHVWMYHLLGGRAAQLRPPPAAGASAYWSNTTFSHHSRLDDKFKAERERLLLAIKRAAEASPERDAFERQLSALRCGPVAVEWLRLPAASASASVSATSARATDRAAAGGDGSPTPVDTNTEQQRHTDALHAFLMGTDERLGAGWASRQKPCAVRLIASSRDLLGLIADFVRGKPQRALAPPP